MQAEESMPTDPEKIQTGRLAELDKYFDKDYARALIQKLGNLCHETYFRSRFINFDLQCERNQKDTPLIFISNHSGMAFPWDAMVMNSIYNHKRNFAARALRPLVAPMLSATALMNPYMIRNMWKKMGGVDARFANFETLMQQPAYDVMMYPEGIPGIGKGFNRRYQLQKFHTSYVRMAVKYRTDLYWISTVNGEYINPYSYSFPWLDRIFSKIGIPFLPVSPMLLLLIVQPWIFYFAFPARLTFVLGKRIPVYEWVDKPYGEISQDEFVAISERVRKICQAELDEAVAEYGKNAYDWRHWWKTVVKNKRYFPFYLPLFWPLIYSDFDRRYRKYKDGNFDIELSFKSLLLMLLKNPIFWAYFIPVVGWIPLLIKGYWQHDLD